MTEKKTDDTQVDPVKSDAEVEVKKDDKTVFKGKVEKPETEVKKPEAKVTKAEPEVKAKPECKKLDNEVGVKQIKKTDSDYIGRLEGGYVKNDITESIIKFRALPSSVYTHLYGLASQETGFLNSGDFTRLCAQYGIYEFENMKDENDDPVVAIRETKKIIGAGTVYYIRSDIIDNLWVGMVNVIGNRVIQLSRMDDQQVMKTHFTMH